MNSNAADSSSPEKRVHLPDPDTDNITVLTRELPNEPILPWHHYDSPWLEAEEGSEETKDEESEAADVGAEAEPVEAPAPEMVEGDADQINSEESQIVAPPLNSDLDLVEDGAIAPEASISPLPEAASNGTAATPDSDDKASSEPVQSSVEATPITPVLPFLTLVTPEAHSEDSTPTPESGH